MAEQPLKNGARVEVVGKNVQGTVAFVGTTHFSSGKWVGVVLDEAKGKNNGNVQGKAYFQCKDNHGIFVRQSQLLLLDDDTSELGAGEGAASNTSKVEEFQTPTTGTEEKKSRLSRIPTSDLPSPREEIVRTPGSKRSSFIETNFVETISYSPGAGGLEERVTNLQNLQEIEALRAEVKDYTEKLATLKGKRLQDKEKLKEAEKMKIQFLQLLEFKTKIMESQSELQRELQKARQDAQDAINEKEQHAEEMADLAESVEMATLDREMAEEKSETLQAELDQTKEKLEELQLDFEILKNEISEKGRDGAASNYHTKQLEQQNERLREALVKLRDLSAHDKQEQHRFQRECDQQKSELTELNRTKEKLSAQIETYEKQIVDLQEQVDAALGAEEMVEQLAERNLNLEEKLVELQDSVSDLEMLHEMNEELHENARETEMELREEVDLANGRSRELVRQMEGAHETIADFEQTIQKFRVLTESLKEHNKELVDRLQVATNMAVAPSTDLFDFKIKFEETKAHAKAVDMELRRIEVQQANQHTNFLRSFMSDEFLARGGDHDALLVLLLLPRIVWKAEILVNQVREKYPLPNTITSETVLKDHAVEQHSFSNHFIYLLYCMQNLLHQFISALNSCSVELFLKFGTLYPELAVQEKAIDFYIDLLKKDQLDENIILEPLEKSLAFFQHLYGIHLNDERVDCSLLMLFHTKLGGVACDGISLELQRLQILLQAGEESSEMGSLYKELESYNNELKQLTKKMRRRLPQEGKPNSNSFEKEVKVQLLECNLHIGRILQTLREFGQAVVQHALVSEGTRGLTNQKLKELAHQASDKVYGKEDSGPIDCLRQSMTILIENLTKLSTRMQGGEFDFDGTPEAVPAPPIQIRAETIKSELKDIQNLKLRLESKEVDLVEAKKHLKIKSEELSELSVRKDLLEKKVETGSKESEGKVHELENKLKEVTKLYRKKEKEFEETMDHLQADIDALENERGELKEKLKLISKKALFENITKTTALVGSPTSPTVPSLTGSVINARDSPMLVQQIGSLKAALDNVLDENNRLKARLIKNQLASLPPIQIPRKTAEVNENVPEDKRLDDLCAKTKHLLTGLKKLSVSATVVDISKRKPGLIPTLDKSSPTQHVVQHLSQVNEFQKNAAKLQVEVTNFLATQHMGGSAKTDFSDFPTPEFSKVLQENQQLLQPVGRIYMPSDKTSGKQIIPVILDPQGLKRLHQLLSSH
uniref:Dynactin subunit 1 n=1 Tax=Strigamia maritima TaxID=126957 RepID=T1J0Z5_STRMM